MVLLYEFVIIFHFAGVMAIGRPFCLKNRSLSVRVRLPAVSPNEGNWNTSRIKSARFAGSNPASDSSFHRLMVGHLVLSQKMGVRLSLE